MLFWVSPWVPMQHSVYLNTLKHIFWCLKKRSFHVVDVNLLFDFSDIGCRKGSAFHDQWPFAQGGPKRGNPVMRTIRSRLGEKETLNIFWRNKCFQWFSMKYTSMVRLMKAWSPGTNIYTRTQTNTHPVTLTIKITFCSYAKLMNVLYWLSFPLYI